MPYPGPRNKRGDLRHRTGLLPERAIFSAESWDFAGFALHHVGCGDKVMEVRLDEESMMCWCLRCDVLRVFGVRGAAYPIARARHTVRRHAEPNESQGGNAVHAIRVLEEDHARIAALLEELADADSAARTKLSERLTKELVDHTIAEDNIFLPHVEEAIEDSKRMTEEFFERDVLSEASGLITEAYEHNGRIRDLLERLRPVPAQEEIDALRKAVRLHIALEEELFPKAREVLEEEDFERIGDLIEHCKWQVRGLAQARLSSSSSYRPSPVEVTLPE